MTSAASTPVKTQEASQSKLGASSGDTPSRKTPRKNTPAGASSLEGVLDLSVKKDDAPTKSTSSRSTSRSHSRASTSTAFNKMAASGSGSGERERGEITEYDRQMRNAADKQMEAFSSAFQQNMMNDPYYSQMLSAMAMSMFDPTLMSMPPMLPTPTSASAPAKVDGRSLKGRGRGRQRTRGRGAASASTSSVSESSTPTPVFPGFAFENGDLSSPAPSPQSSLQRGSGRGRSRGGAGKAGSSRGRGRSRNVESKSLAELAMEVQEFQYHRVSFQHTILYLLRVFFFSSTDAKLKTT